MATSSAVHDYSGEFQVLADLLGVAVLRVDRSMDLRGADANACRLFRVTRAADLAAAWPSLCAQMGLAAEQPTGVRPVTAAAAVGDERLQLRGEVRPLGGQDEDCLLLLRPVGQASPVEEQALAACHARVLSFLASKLVHDLNGPANNIHIALSLLESAVDALALTSPADAGTPLRLQRYVKVLKDETARLSERIRELPSHIALRGNGQEEEVELCALADEIGRLVKHETTARQVRRSISLPPRALPVRARREELKLALLGLAVTLIDAVGEGGELAIEVEAGQRQAQVCLSGRGDSLADDLFASLQGLGYGGGGRALAPFAARLVLERCGGRISGAWSDGAALFQVVLPLAAARP
ncbi:MAG: hypothetical protein ACOZCP_19655 [Pseudomonadota bacterium]